jgi:rhamnosyl/mannosyltransferase
MRILHVYKDYFPVRGGIEHHLQVLAEGQARRGHEVQVLVAARSGPTTVATENGVRVTRSRRLLTTRSTPISPPLMARTAAADADLVHLHVPHPPGEAAWLWSRNRPPAVATYHSDIVRQRWLGAALRPVLHRVLGRCARILATSRRYADSSPVLRHHRERIEVVPLGIDPAPFAAAEGAAHAWRELYPPPLVLFVGCLRHYKGIDHLITAMASLEATLLVAGSGPERDRLAAMAARSVAASRIHLLGDVAPEELPSLYAAGDVLVLPSTSRAEAFGLVQLEAMAAATPVVSTELGTGTSVVNRDGETGRVVSPADVTALRSAIAELLHDPGLARRLGANGRRRVHEHFTADAMVDRVLEVYSEVLS